MSVQDRSFAAYRLGALAAIGIGAATAGLAWQLSVGSFAEPGPGLWPFITSLLVLGCGIALLWVDQAVEYERWTRQCARPLSGIAILAGFIVLFGLVSFAPAAALMLAVWLRLLARERWVTTLLVAICVPVALQLVFEVWLGVSFPIGMLGWTLGFGTST